MSWPEVPISVWTRTAAPVADGGPGDGLEAPPLAARDAVVRGAALDRAGPRRVEGQRRVVPVGRVHARASGRSRSGRRSVSTVASWTQWPGGVVGVAVVAADAAITVRPVASATARMPAGSPAEPDRRHLDDRPDPARLPVARLLDRALGVGEALARHAGRVEEQVVVRVDDAERADRRADR